MEDWQNSSLEEKVDLDNLVLFPPDSYPISGINELRSSYKEEQCEEDNYFIDNPAQNDIKTEKVELIERDNDTRSFEFSINGGEICQICGLEFGNKAVLKIHTSLVHPEEKKNAQNVDLGRKDEVVHEHEIAKSDHLKKDIKLVHEGIKSFNCSICEYKAGRKYTLKKHTESVHVGIKPFRCNICDYEFATKSKLKQHIESVHEGIKAFKCNICDFKTAKKGTLKKHTESVHEGIKPFRCNICEYKAGQKHTLKKHIEIFHEGINKFKCNISDLKFTEKGTLKRHLKTVHEEIKPFKCDICKYKAGQRKDLEKHIEVLYMSFDSFLLAVESRDLSQADKIIVRVSSFPS